MDRRKARVLQILNDETLLRFLSNRAGLGTEVMLHVVSLSWAADSGVRSPSEILSVVNKLGIFARFFSFQRREKVQPIK